MVVNERPAKRMKRRVTADLYDFLTFPVAGDASSDGPFRNSVQRFLSDHARITFPPSLFPSFMTWQILFRVGDIVHGPDLSPAMVTLDIVEEDVTRSRTSVYCDQCRVVGWSSHPVCRKRYHFIIRAASNAIEAYQRPCSRCGNLLQLSETRSCNFVITVDDLEDWVYLQIEDNTHLLHGVVHANGYGHLLTLNGREGGSKLLSGSVIMGFWDRLCAAISVRKVSVMDLSKKFGLEYRLLHAVTNGHSWYGNWGYEFGTGSYALTQDAYKEAVNTLSSMPLSSFSFHGRGPRSRLQCVISLYQSLADTELLTIEDLFGFLLTLVYECRKPTTTPTGTSKQHEYSSTTLLCAWTGKEVEDVQQALIKVLLASDARDEAKWVTRRALKGAVCRSVASPELLDYCLKNLQGKSAADGMVVCSRCNPISSAIEFRLGPSTNGVRANSCYPSEEQVVSDLKFLFDSIIHPDKMLSYRPRVMRKRVANSARKLLDCKQFMKDYKPDEVAVEQPSVIRLWCHVELSDQPKDDPSPPPELIVLPLNATVADLKSEVTSAFQEVYAMYKRFQAEELLGYGSISDSLTVKFLLGTSGSIQIQGKCPAKNGLSRFRMERGTEAWKVDCTCGAKDDDGEKMLACDTCGIWQHTRCAGIKNSDGMPSKFVCERCVHSYREETKKLPDSGDEAYKTCNLNTSCRDEAVATDCASAAVACNISVNFGVR
ncbi:PHD finger protein At1g33420-like isoform X2 [Abrus precatorius]|uniref:PHD finger protein At1g33420-like isoform X2 n=1 Tax=Abrus precatorius TaxID=3816 RepID=A0A8B8LBM5_ABRPR|nr:PHD finger protein At1g33420-like isoform X2 [Abrus precatorius]